MFETIKQKLSGLFNRDGEDRGVSPVIGVILMVAITVILAAVIGAFVLGLGDGISTGAQAGATISTEGDTATITWNSAGNSDSLNITTDNTSITPTTEQLTSVGETSTVSLDAEGTETVTITVIANAGDDSSVVAQETVTLER